MFAYKSPNSGNLRETFFLNQLEMRNHVSAPKYGNFLVDSHYVFEVRGSNKTFKQLQGVPNGYLAIDEIDENIVINHSQPIIYNP